MSCDPPVSERVLQIQREATAAMKRNEHKLAQSLVAEAIRVDRATR